MRISRFLDQKRSAVTRVGAFVIAFFLALNQVGWTAAGTLPLIHSDLRGCETLRFASEAIEPPALPFIPTLSPPKAVVKEDKLLSPSPSPPVIEVMPDGKRLTIDPKATEKALDVKAKALEALLEIGAFSAHVAWRTLSVQILVAEDLDHFESMYVTDPAHSDFVVVLNANFFAKLNDQEMMFWIGHILGHVWQGDTGIKVTDFELPAQAISVESRADVLGIWLARHLFPQGRDGYLASFFSKVLASRILFSEGKETDLLFHPKAGPRIANDVKVRTGNFQSLQELLRLFARPNWISSPSHVDRGLSPSASARPSLSPEQAKLLEDTLRQIVGVARKSFNLDEHSPNGPLLTRRSA